MVASSMPRPLPSGELLALSWKALLCDEVIRLALICSKAARDYSDAVTIMGATARASNFQKYGQARDVADCCRVVLERARLMLDEHVAEHGC